MKLDDVQIDSLCEAILKGRGVDWDALRQSFPPETADGLLVQSLLCIAEVDHAHRTLQFGTSDDLPFPRWCNLRLLERLDSGAYGELFRVRDESLGRDVALKLYRADAHAAAAASLMEEARRLARVRHDNVVLVHGVDVDHGRVGFWMDLVLGRSLEAVIEDDGRVEPRVAIETGIALARALGATHAAGVLHGDVKPRNVMCGDGGRVVLVDFGAGRSTSLASLRAHGTGTPLFMAPETLLEGTSTPQSDLYGLGALLFNALTGRYPVEADDLDELAGLHHVRAVAATSTRRRADPRLPELRALRADVSPALAAIVTRCLAADPARRFASAADVEASLTRLAGARRRRARSVALAIGCAAGLAAIAAGVWGSVQRRPAPPLPQSQRCYLAAKDAYARRDFDTARGLFRDAVSYDSTFALAYYDWSICEAFWDEQVAQPLAARAFHHSARVDADTRVRIHSWYYLLSGQPDDAIAVLAEQTSRRPRSADAWYQLGRTYWFHLGRPRDAVPCYRRALALDAHFAQAYNDLAYCYTRLGVVDSAVAAARHYVALEPDEANAYDTLGDVLMAVDADSARAAYEVAVAHKTNFVITIAKLSQLAAARGDFATARSWAERVIASDDPRYRADARLMLGAIEIYQGRFAAGERAVDRALALGTHEHAPPRELGQTHAVRAQLLRRKGEREAALAELAIATRLYPRSYQASPDHLQPERVRILLELGRVLEARALVDSLAAAPAHPNANMRYPLFVAQAILALHDGDPARARVLLERPDVSARATTLMVATRWADAMTALGEPRHAAQRLDAALVTFIADEPVATVECLVQAARAWEAAGEPARAAACWERFLAAWGDADWLVPEAVHARQRLTALRTGGHAATTDPIDAASALD